MASFTREELTRRGFEAFGNVQPYGYTQDEQDTTKEITQPKTLQVYKEVGSQLKEAETADLLKLEYPIFAGNIDTARSRGYTDEQIREYLNKREFRARAYYPHEEVEKAFGRTPETWGKFWTGMYAQRDAAYVNLLKDEMPEERIRDIVKTARLTGISPSLLFRSPELLKKAEQMAGERVGIISGFIGSVRNAVASHNSSSAGKERFEASELRRNLNNEQVLLSEAGLAIDTGEVSQGVYSYSEMIEIGRERLNKRIELLEKDATIDEQDAQDWYVHMRPVDSRVGAFLMSAIESSGMTVMSSIRSGAAWALGGPIAGLATSLYNTYDESQREAGEAFMEALQRGKSDEEAYKIGRQVRNRNLLGLSISNFAGDILTFGLTHTGSLLTRAGAAGAGNVISGLPNVGESILGKIAGKITGDGLASKFARFAITKGVPLVAGAIPEGAEEYMQEWIKSDALGDEIDEEKLWEAFRSGMGQAVIYSLFGLGSRAVMNKVFGQNQQAQSEFLNALGKEAKEIGELGEKLARGEIKPDDVVRNDPVIFIPKSALTDEAREALGLNNAEQTDTEGEAAVRQSVWDKFAEEHPEQAQALQNDIRTGVKGITVREEFASKWDALINKASDKLNSGTPQAEAARNIVNEQAAQIKEVSQQLGGNISDEEINAWTRVYGHYLLTMSERLNITPEELHRTRVEKKQDMAALYEQRMFHGTRHNLGGAFDLLKIGTGEGAQAYGWGIYLAERRGVSESYRLAGAEPKSIKDYVFTLANGDKVTPKRRPSGLLSYNNFIGSVAVDMCDYGKTLQQAIEDYKKVLKDRISRSKNKFNTLVEHARRDGYHDFHYYGAREAKADFRRAEKLLETIEKNPPVSVKQELGNLYTVEGPENDILLDYDAPMAEQPGLVRGIIRKIGSDKNLWKAMPEEITGYDIYKKLSRLLGSDKAASELLNKYGIPGLRYWDGMSRKKGEGTHNFVIWNTDLLKIMGVEGDAEGVESYKQTSSSNNDEINNEQIDYEVSESNLSETESQSGVSDAEARLAADEQAFGEAVDKINDMDGSEHIKVMTTPLVFKLAGAEILPLYMDAGKIKDVLNSPHGITVDILKQIPRALADPIAIFESKTHPNDSIVVMTEILDADGATVVVPVQLNKTQHTYEINRIASVYGKKNDKTGEVHNNWFLEQIEAGRLKYINRQKSSQWSNQTGLQLPAGTNTESLNISIPDETDLAKLRNENQGLYQSEATPTAAQTDNDEVINGSVSFSPLRHSDAVISLTQTANASTFLHELWHIALDDLLTFGRREGVSEQIRADVQTAMEYLGIEDLDFDLLNATARERANWTQEDFDKYEAEKERLHIAQEKWADAGEAYFTTGKAPTIELQGVFQRLKAWLLEIYNGIKNNIELTDDIREVFDRLLALDDDITEADILQSYMTVGQAMLEGNLLNERVQELDAEADDLEGQQEEYNQIIGQKGAYSLDLREEINARLNNLKIARQMETDGHDTRNIRYATGWERGKDGKWRYEIMDGQVRTENISKNSSITLAEIYDSPELFKAYPQLKKLPVVFRDWGKKFYGAFHPVIRQININKKLPAKKFKATLVHEIQHAIQHIEGFTTGTGLRSAGGYDNYRRHAGEVEARNTETRMNMSDYARRITRLAATEDVSREDQLMLGNANETYNQVVNIPETQTEAIRKQYEGTEQWLKAPNGKKSYLDEKQWLQVRTPAFKAWFGDWEKSPQNASKVVDKNGEPLVVWHGTPNGKFSVFDKRFIGKTSLRYQGFPWSDLGFYFSSDDSIGRGYSREYGGDSYVFSVFLNLRNPLIIEDTGWGSARNQIDTRHGDLKRWAKEENRDGIIVRSLDEPLIDEATDIYDSVYVAFEPEQIKSATGNVGTFDAGNPDIFYQISKNRKQTMNSVLQKYRDEDGNKLTDEQRKQIISNIEALGERIKSGGYPKLENAAVKWIKEGHITLPNDEYKIIDAIKICEQRGLDAMKFNDPNEILAKYTIKETKAEKRINPDTVPEFSNKQELLNGITVYTVQDDKAGQEAVRKIIDTHWGDKANPWCLAARIDGNLDRAWQLWQHYNGTKKRIAFKDGKLLAFSANKRKIDVWWDREDIKHERGIPVIVKDKNKTTTYYYDEFFGNFSKYMTVYKNGLEQVWHSNGQIALEKDQNGIRKWDASGQLNFQRLARENRDVVYDDFSDGALWDAYGDDVFYQIGKNRKSQMDLALRKRRPDLNDKQRVDVINEIEKLGEEVKGNRGYPKLEKAATKWVLEGHIILPEDNYKIIDAIKISEQEHIDPMSFNDPNEILAKYTIKETKAEKRLDPDTVPEFSNKQVLPYGVTVYTVDDNEDGQRAVRAIIDSHWGKDANPWCLVARDNNDPNDPYDGLYNAWDYWSETYVATEKRIAFQNGKLLAFSASDEYEGPDGVYDEIYDDLEGVDRTGLVRWWDREDKPLDGIPITIKENGSKISCIYNEYDGSLRKLEEITKDKIRRTFYNNGQVHFEFRPDDTYTELSRTGQKLAEKLADGTEITYYQFSGSVKSKKFTDGTELHYYENSDQLLCKILPDKTIYRYYEDGQLKGLTLPNGEYRFWFINGKLGEIRLPDGTYREWSFDGRILSYRNPDDSGWAYGGNGVIPDRPDLDRENFTSFVHSLDDLQKETFNQISGPELETINQSQPRSAEESLAEAEKTWGETVNEIVSTERKDIFGDDYATVMRTPLVFAFSKKLNKTLLPMTANKYKMKRVMAEHPEITPDILKRIPRAITDPIAIFKSKTYPDNNVVVMTDILDKDKATVIAAIWLNKQSVHHLANNISSVYGKKDKWFIDEIKSGRLLYINKKKFAQWLNRTGYQLPAEEYEQIINSVPNKNNLVKLRNKNETFYQHGNNSPWLAAGAAQDVDGWLAQMDEYNNSKEQYQNIREVINYIKELGGLRFEDFVNALGQELAEDVRNNWRQLFVKHKDKPQLSLDVLLQQLNEIGFNFEYADDFINWLNNITATQPKRPAPIIEINSDTMNALINRLGFDGAREYISERRKYLNRLQREIQAEYDRDKTNAEVKADLEATYKEQIEIAKALERINWAFMQDKADIPDWLADTSWLNGDEQQRRPAQPETLTLSDAYKRGLKMAEQYSREAYNLGRKEQRKADSERIQKLNDKIKEVREKTALLKRQQKAKQEVNKLVQKMITEINAAAKDENIIWHAQEDIKKELEGVILKHRNRRGSFVSHLLGNIFKTSENLTDSEMQNLGISQADLDYINSQTLDDMTISELYHLHQRISTLRAEGQRELELKKLLDKERVDKIHTALMASLAPKLAARPRGAVTGKKDKIYPRGIKGTAQKVSDYINTRVLGAQRFFDRLDGGKGHFDGAWIKYFVDNINEAESEKLRNVFKRREWIENKMREFGLTSVDLAKTRNVNVPKEDGRPWTVDQLMSIYAGLNNEKSAQAILYGNFAEAGSEEQAISWAAECVQALTENEKKFADAIVEEYEMNFERINNALIDVYNKGMNHELNYTPMKRVEANPNSGIDTPDTAQTMIEEQNKGAVMGEVKTGFAESRQELRNDEQIGIDLGLYNIWNSQMELQEHSAAYARPVQDLRRVLTTKSEGQNITLLQAIKLVHGKDAQDFIKNYFHIAAQNQTLLAHDMLDGASGWLARNMSIAYLCANLGTALMQTTSFWRAIPYSGATHLLNAFRKFAINPKKFLNECYKLDPQLKARSGNLMLQAMKSSEKLGTYGKIIDMGMKPIQAFDKWTSAMVWRAVYDNNIAQGKSQEAAIREAQRAVALTQPTIHVKDAPMLWQQKGLVKLAMIFSNDMAQRLGIPLYDLAASFREGNVPKIFATMLSVTLSAAMVGLLSKGGPDDWSDPEEWASFIGEELTRQSVESIPLLGKGLLNLWDTKGYSTREQSAYLAPFARLINGVRGLSDKKKDNNEQAIFNLIEAGALIAPFPVTGLRRIWQTGDYAARGDIENALKRIIGQRMDMKKLKKKVRF